MKGSKIFSEMPHSLGSYVCEMAQRETESKLYDLRTSQVFLASPDLS